jgi:predicted Fe-Mo cluster-binding NifX family protein
LDNVIIGVVQLRKDNALKVEIEDFGRELGAAKNYLSFAFALSLIFVVCASAFGTSLMSRQYHVLIPANVPDAGGGVSAELGRSPYFYLYRVDKEKGQFLPNRLAFVRAEIDRDVARLFRNYSVEAIITRNIGPHLFEELNSAGVLIYRAEPKAPIHQQIERFRQGDLEQMTRPNVDVQFGLRNFRLLSPWYNWQRR